MKILSSFPFLLLAYQLLLTTATASYYRTTFDCKECDSIPNLYKLRCRSSPIPQNMPDITRWLFNGSNYTMSPCFAGAVLHENTLIFNHSSNCDGYIQCGNGTEYSDSIQLLAKPEHSSFYRQEQANIVRPYGSSVTLPCDIIVSAIGLNVRWKKRAANSDITKTLSVPLNEDYSITLTNLDNLTPTFYHCEVIVINENTITHGRYFRLTVIEYSPPHIIDFITSNDEDKIQIVLTASGTDLKFSWFLDDNELNDSTNGIEIINKNDGMQSTLQLSHNIVTSAKNLTAFASNIDTTNSSDLRGMGSEVMRNKNDSVQLWLYPAITVFPSTMSDSKCEEMIVTYKSLSGAFAFVLLAMIVVVSLLCFKLCWKNIKTTCNSSKTTQGVVFSHCKDAQNPESSTSDTIRNETSTSDSAQNEASPSESTLFLSETTPQNPAEKCDASTQMQDCKKEQLIDSLYKALCKAIESKSSIKKYRKELRSCRDIIEKIKDELDFAVSDCGKGPQGESSQRKMHEKYENMHKCIKELLGEK